MGTSPRNRWRVAAVPVATVALLIAGWFGWRAVRSAPDASAPSCPWPARIENANSDQDGLIRCYLSAIARHDASELRAVVRSRTNGGPTGFSAADFTHSRDARGGTATATVVANANDDADAVVKIRYTDGVRQQLEIHLANPASSHSWRFMGVGTYPSQPGVPSPAGR